MQTENYDFAMLAYQLIVAERIKDLDEVASAMGMKYATLHARLNRRTHFKPAEIKALIKHMPDARLAMHFLDETPFVVALRADGETDGHGVMEHVHRSLFRVVEILRLARDSLNDGFIDHRERKPLLDEIEKAEIALASLKGTVIKTYQGPPLAG